MKRVVGIVAVMTLVSAAQAQGQTTPAPQVPPAPQARQEAPPEPGTKWYLGALSGVQSVARNAPIAGGEFGIRLRRNWQVVVEAGWFKDVVTDSRINEVGSFVSYLQQTQGLPASGDIDAPVWFGSLGLRYVHPTSSGVRPYVLATGGLARVEYRPTFILNNLNITTSVGQYGITMGKDLLGPGLHPAYGGGAGLIFGDRWYLDLGVRWTRIHTPDHATDVRRVNIGIGRRF